MSMFCPKCHGLLKTRKRGSSKENYCPKCENTPVTYTNPSLLSGPDSGIPYFPYSVVRDGQREFMDDVRDTISSGKHLLAYAPTGLGKTAAVLAPAVEHSLKTGKKIIFLTAKQSHHQIAVQTLRDISVRHNVGLRVVDIISKQAMCPRDIAREHPLLFHDLCTMDMRNNNCSYFKRQDKELVKDILGSIYHVDELKKAASRKGVCPHKVAMECASAANVVICDYNYIFDPDIRETVMESLETEPKDMIVVVDEAHNLPDRIRGYLNLSLTANRLGDAISEVGSNSQQAHFLNRLRGTLVKMQESIPMGEELLISREFLAERLEEILKGTLYGTVSTDDFIQDLRKAGEKKVAAGEVSASIAVAEFFSGYMKDMPGIVRGVSNVDQSRAFVSLLDPSVVSAPIFKEIYSCILMSGTLHPPDMYADLLGIEPERRVMKHYPSPFLTENRPVYVVPDVTTLYKKRSEDTYNRYALHISRLSSVIPGNIAIFFPSYGIMSSIRNALENVDIDKEIIVENRGASKKDKEKWLVDLEGHKRKKGALLLGVMGGSMSEGVDYRNNLLDSVFIVGVPLAPPSLEQKELIRYYDEKFGDGKGRDYGYLYPAMNRIFQAMGRCIRSEDDRAVVVLMDERFRQSNYRRGFPDEVTLRYTRSMKEEIRDFYRSKP